MRIPYGLGHDLAARRSSIRWRPAVQWRRCGCDVGRRRHTFELRQDDATRRTVRDEPARAVSDEHLEQREPATTVYEPAASNELAVARDRPEQVEGELGCRVRRGGWQHRLDRAPER